MEQKQPLLRKLSKATEGGWVVKQPQVCCNYGRAQIWGGAGLGPARPQVRAPGAAPGPAHPPGRAE